MVFLFIIQIVCCLSPLSIFPCLKISDQKKVKSDTSFFSHSRMRSFFKFFQGNRRLESPVKFLPLYPTLQTLSENPHQAVSLIENYFLRGSSKSLFLSQKECQWMNLVDLQSTEPELNSLMEVITNGIDASVKDIQIGQFNKGVKQLLIHLKDVGDMIRVTSRKEGETSINRLFMWQHSDGLKFNFSQISSFKAVCGTYVEVMKAKGFSFEGKFLKKHAKWRYQSVSGVTLMWNNKRLQPTFKMLNGSVLEVSKNIVDIQFSENRFSCLDSGCGMNEKELLLMFVPLISKKLEFQMTPDYCPYIYIDEKTEKTGQISSVSLSRYSESLVRSFFCEGGGRVVVELGDSLQTYESRESICPNQQLIENLLLLIQSQVLDAENLSSFLKVNLIRSIYRTVKNVINLNNPYELYELKKLSESLVDKILPFLKILLESSSYVFLDQEYEGIDWKGVNRKIILMDNDILPESIEKRSIELLGAQEVGQSKDCYEKDRLLYVYPYDFSEDLFLNGIKEQAKFPIYRTSRLIFFPECLLDKTNSFSLYQMSLFISPYCQTNYEKKGSHSVLDRLSWSFPEKCLSSKNFLMNQFSQVHQEIEDYLKCEETNQEVEDHLKCEETNQEERTVCFNAHTLLDPNVRIMQVSEEFYLIIRISKNFRKNFEYQIRSKSELYEDQGKWWDYIEIYKGYMRVEEKNKFGLFKVNEQIQLSLMNWNFIRFLEENMVVLSYTPCDSILCRLGESEIKDRAHWREIFCLIKGQLYGVRSRSSKLYGVGNYEAVQEGTIECVWRIIMGIGDYICYFSDKTGLWAIGRVYEKIEEHHCIYKDVKQLQNGKTGSLLLCLVDMDDRMAICYNDCLEKNDFFWSKLAYFVSQNEEGRRCCMVKKDSLWGIFWEGQNPRDVQLKWKDIVVSKRSQGVYVCFQDPQTNLWGYGLIHSVQDISSCRVKDVMISESTVIVSEFPQDVYVCSRYWRHRIFFEIICCTIIF